MAQRTGEVGAAFVLRVLVMASLPLREAEEEMSGAMRAGDRLGHGAERAIRLALKGEAVFQDFDLKRAALVTAGQDRSRPRQAVIDRHAQDRGWLLRCSASIGGR